MMTEYHRQNILTESPQGTSLVNILTKCPQGGEVESNLYNTTGHFQVYLVKTNLK